MIQLLFITILLIGLICASVWMSPNVFATPATGFLLCFLPSVLLAFFYIQKWHLILSAETMVALVLGFCTFFITSALYSFIKNKGRIALHRNKWYKDADYEAFNKPLFISNSKLYLFAAFQIFVLALEVMHLRSLGVGSLSNAIAFYRILSIENYEEIAMSSLTQLLRIMSVSSGYIWTFILIKNTVFGYKKGRYICALNIILSMLNGIILGSRTEIIQLIVAAIVQWYFVTQIKGRWKQLLSIKHIMKGIGVLAILICSFRFLGDITGRTVSWDLMDYMAIYFSAELKNLDLFITDYTQGADIYHCQTLVFLVNWFSGKFGLPDWYHSLDIPFRSVNGYSLGNVGTVFYAFYYDAGILGVVVFTMLMALLANAFFYNAYLPKRKPGNISMNIIIYSYVFFTIIFSFFSNKFFEQIFHITFVKYILCWFTLVFFLERLEFKGRFKILIRGKSNG